MCRVHMLAHCALTQYLSLHTQERNGNLLIWQSEFWEVLTLLGKEKRLIETNSLIYLYACPHLPLQDYSSFGVQE